MWPRAALASLAASSLVSLTACGSAPPSEATIYYDPALRPGVVEASDAERQLLARLDEVPPGQSLEIAGHVYVAEAPYAAASGRLCRSVRVRAGERETPRLACEADQGWVFVPDVFVPDVFAGDAP